MKYEIKEFDTRYFAGIEHPNGVDISLKQMDLQKTWTELFKVHPEKIENKVEPNNFIGLECYPPDFMDEKVFDYRLKPCCSCCRWLCWSCRPHSWRLYRYGR